MNGTAAGAHQSPAKKPSNTAIPCNCAPAASQDGDKAALLPTNFSENSIRLACALPVALPWYNLNCTVSTVADTPPPATSFSLPHYFPLRI
jgi:hypothetical protein